MGNLSTELLLIIFCALVVLSYLFSIASRYIKIPSVLLLLIFGITARWIAEKEHWGILIPERLVEFLGVIGLRMIVLEAGLDLQLSKAKITLIRNSFLAALVIFILSVAGISGALYFWMREPVIQCVVYAIPLSIMSSSIVLPSLHHLSAAKKEFLVYEASFSDILGILIFNYFIGKEILTAGAITMFFLNIVFALILSFLFSVILFLILAKSALTVKFFLVFSLLIILYEGGKMMDLPSLIIILVFGILMNNWRLIKIPRLQKLFPIEEVQQTTKLLHSITAESAFLIRTFFFILFGFSINISVIGETEVLMIGSSIVVILFLSRLLYLKFFLRESVYPEVFFIPRGLITILLFYKIPEALKLTSFNDGILFFVILVTSLIMMLGMFYKTETTDF